MSLDSFFSSTTENNNNHNKNWNHTFGNENTKWTGISYEEYIEKIKASSTTNDFTKELAEKYCSFVQAMLDIAQKVVYDRLNNERKIFVLEDNRKELKKYRIQDFYDKLSASVLLSRLKNDLELEKGKEFVKKFVMKPMYEHQEPTVEISFDFSKYFYLYIDVGQIHINLDLGVSLDRYFKDLKDKRTIKNDLKQKIDALNNSANEKVVDKNAATILVNLTKMFSEKENGSIEEKIEFQTRGNKKGSPFTYKKKDKYLTKYGKIPLKGDISYEELKNKVSTYLDVMAEYIEGDGYKEIEDIGERRKAMKK